MRLLSYCAAHALDYTACTSVTCVLAGSLLSCAHLGDSKAVLGRMDSHGGLSGRYLTTDHKPDVREAVGGGSEYWAWLPEKGVPHSCEGAQGVM